MNLNWYYQRLRSMPLQEVLYRVKKGLWQKHARITRLQRSCSFHKNATGDLEIHRFAKSVKFFGIDDFDLSQFPNSWSETIVQKADLYLNNRYSYLSLKEIQMPDPYLWNYEPIKKIELPLEFAFHMDYRDTKTFGDFKYFWEHGRFAHLITLSKAYYLTGDKIYAQQVHRQLESFVEQCPYLLGVHWTMAMETALRLIAICWIAAFLGSYLRENQSLCRVLEELVQSHLAFIPPNYSLYSSGNNHYISEVTGVFFATCCFGQQGHFSKYRAQAHHILEKEIEKQFYPDGVNKEQSSHYHVSCLYCFLLAGILGKNNQMDFSVRYWQRIEKGIEYVAALCRSDGSIPQVGDSDDGETVHLMDTGTSLYHSLLATGAVLFNRPDFKAKSIEYDEMSMWLLGMEGKKIYEDLDSVSDQRETIVFPDGGYYFIRSGQPKVEVVIDCGPLGFGTLAGHGHADCLSFILALDGVDVFVDPGTYIYHASNPFRDFFRKTEAHNTAEVDGQDQSQIQGPFLWGRKAVPTLELWQNDAQAVKFRGSHDGYTCLGDPVVHQRGITWHKKQAILEIQDTFHASLNHDVRLFFHLSEYCTLEKIDKTHWVIQVNGQPIKMETDPALDFNAVYGKEDSLHGWASRKYDEKFPVHTLIAKTRIEGSKSFIQKIYLN